MMENIIAIFLGGEGIGESGQKAYAWLFCVISSGFGGYRGDF